MGDDGEAESAGEDEYDPLEHVPDRIDAISVSGLVEMHDALNEENTAQLESFPIEDQAIMLWKMVEKGEIDVDLTEANRQ